METCWTTHVCPDCRKIKNLMNIYGKTQVISVLDNVLVRNTAGIINKEEDIKRKGLVKIPEDKKETIDEEEKVATRSKTKK
tara:strand:+ start:1562 stop:1804 length:243 start_codon:yes stop_codon:yes gene_type:complete